VWSASALVGYIGLVLLLALAFLIALTAYALWRRTRAKSQEQKACLIVAHPTSHPAMTLP
tara:strand:- start:857 stop:1036 length:180 start_codon:yes stop_codon:yes gene_type:complete